MTYENIIPILINFLVSGGLIGGIYALLKLRPEAGQITVTAAQGAVIVQTGVIDNLREELERMERRLDEQEKRFNKQKTDLEMQIHELQNENERLRARVRELEKASK